MEIIGSKTAPVLENVTPIQEDVTHTRSPRKLLRVCVIGLIVLQHSLVALAKITYRLIRSGRSAATEQLYRELVVLIEKLGPTFVKFGQVLSSRRDVLPPRLSLALSELHDRVPPMTEMETRAALKDAYGENPQKGLHYEELSLLASGSIASVYRTVLEDGREVALKIRRPGIATTMVADLALLESFVRFSERMPHLRGMPMGDLVGFLATAILGQLDFALEAENLSRIHQSLIGFDLIRVPQPIPELCAANCLAMSYIPDLNAVQYLTLPAQVRVDAANMALMAMGHLMFIEGFTHCDMHPGNLYVKSDGSLVILDAGYSVPLPEEVRILMAEFFFSMATRRGRRCAEIILESAAYIRPDAPVEEFIEAVDELVQKQTHDSIFSMSLFGNEIFALQQRFGLYAKSAFAFPLMSLVVLEGTLQQLNRDVDFRQLGILRNPSEAVLAM